MNQHNVNKRAGDKSQHNKRVPATRDPKDRWFFSQAGVRLITVSQSKDGVFVSLLRFTSSLNPFTSVTTWKLPFKLNNIRAFLMYPYLEEKEKEDKQLVDFLSSFATEQKKFETLMEFRIKSITEALSDDQDKYKPLTKPINSEHDWAERLTDEFSFKYKENAFIKDVLKKNNIKKKF